MRGEHEFIQRKTKYPMHDMDNAKGENKTRPGGEQFTLGMGKHARIEIQIMQGL